FQCLALMLLLHLFPLLFADVAQVTAATLFANVINLAAIPANTFLHPFNVDADARWFGGSPQFLCFYRLGLRARLFAGDWSRLGGNGNRDFVAIVVVHTATLAVRAGRSEEHTSELQSQ